MARCGTGSRTSTLLHGASRCLGRSAWLPWAASAAASFLSSADQTRDGLLDAGFERVQVHSTLEQARAYGARARAMVERGEKAPHRAVVLIHGDIADAAMANTARALQDGRAVPIEVLAYKPATLPIRT